MARKCALSRMPQPRVRSIKRLSAATAWSSDSALLVSIPQPPPVIVARRFLDPRTGRGHVAIKPGDVRNDAVHIAGRDVVERMAGRRIRQKGDAVAAMEAVDRRRQTGRFSGE